MTQFAYDTFTDTAGTDLTAHTGETGATWTADAGNFVLDGDGDVYRTGTTGSSSAAPSGKPANNEQDVTLQFVRVTDTNDFLGAYARWDQSTTTGYLSYFTQSGTHTYIIGKYVNGTWTQLGSKGTSLTAGTIYDATFELRSTAKRILFGATEWLSVTDDTITQTGEVRLYGYGANTATTGCQLSAFEAADTTAGTLTGEAVLAGSATLATDTPTMTSTGGAQPSGIGTLAVGTPLLELTGVATLPGLSEIVASGDVGMFGLASLAGSSAVAVGTPDMALAATAVLAGDAVLAAKLNRIMAGEVAMAGDSALLAGTPLLIINTGAVLAGDAVLVIGTPSMALVGGSLLSGASAVTVESVAAIVRRSTTIVHLGATEEWRRVGPYTVIIMEGI